MSLSDEHITRAMRQLCEASPSGISAASPSPASDSPDGHEVANGREGRALTDRELEVLLMWVGGWSERGMAERLGMSRSGVRSRLEGARRKLGLAMEAKR